MAVITRGPMGAPVEMEERVSLGLGASVNLPVVYPLTPDCLFPWNAEALLPTDFKNSASTPSLPDLSRTGSKGLWLLHHLMEYKSCRMHNVGVAAHQEWVC